MTDKITAHRDNRVSAVPEHTNIDLSIVVPLYNESGNISALADRINTVLQQLDMITEVILVDDGSHDKTWANISEQSSRYSNFHGLKLSRNFGHQHALAAGLTSARGKAIISMDGDLQHPPELILDMVSAWKKGNKIVNTQRIDKEVFGPFKRSSSRLFYHLFSALTDVKMSPGTSDFRLVDRDVVKTILTFGDIDLFWRGAIQWVGYPNTSLPYHAEERHSGKSKYSLKKMVDFASGAIVSFSTMPLKIGIWLGLFTALFAFVELTYVLYSYMAGNTVPGWASVVGIISMLFGIMFICLGLIGVYVARIYASLQNRPRFIIEDSCHSDKPPVKQE